ncbi:MAG: hypothetical protein RAO92_07215 [Candidatus Euphemobacter frigidus]|nr:hypothetical protein [Candidatus Euphemobacter frigidus]MDP8276176.1 hypothetical protein [Candidatus Euphemobacter frigidus]
MSPHTDNTSRDERMILLGMIRTLLNDLKTIQQLGAGYYDSGSFISRYNKLLEVARDLFPGSRMMETFSPIEYVKSVDPVDKMKMTQKVLIEGGQLISLIESSLDRAPESTTAGE